MLFIAPDVVVLDPWAAVAAEYSCFQPPRAAFSLPEPYQRIKAAGGIGASSGSSGSRGALNSGGAVAAVPAPETAEAEQQGRRKRRRRRSYTPNEREEQAAARHAAYAPALRSAAAAVHDWLQRSGARTVHEALAGTLLAGDSQPGWSQRQRRHAVKQLPGAAACCPAGVGAGCGVVHQEADYLALYEARHDAKPKLRYAPEPACALRAAGEPAAKASGTDGTGRQRRSSSGLGVQHEQHPAEAHSANSHLQDVQQDHRPPQPCNLFTHLISTGSARRELLAYAAGHAVLLPPRCRFLLSDARQLAPLLQDAAQAGGYHCVVLDPPWENKSAKRSARYPTLPSRNLLGLPLRRLMHADGCLVAMWVTNRERHRRFIDSELLPAWGLRCVATWHWLKICDGGEPAGRLDIEHRRPYESLLLCWPAHLPPPGPPGSGSAAPGLPDAAVQRTPAAAAAVGEAAGSGQLRQPSARVTAGFHLLPGRELVIAAVPPAEHSRKPHLGGLLLPLLPPGARCLEVFKADALPAPKHMLACTPQAPGGWIASSAVAAALQRPRPACRTFSPPCAGAWGGSQSCRTAHPSLSACETLLLPPHPPTP